ncbi:MAG: putative capsular polysaccharide synthesis family protein [Henriciella sp.]|uniref:putative capsular polysaccharide synthesis family protein n=1 Tax=Henriciella sp. TaxID=1968823 RepID=UPI0032EDBFC9
MARKAAIGARLGQGQIPMKILHDGDETLPDKKNDELIVVYTMGKVASSSVAEALGKADIDYCDVHTLAQKRYLDILRAHMNNPDFKKIPRHLMDSLNVWNAIKADRPIKIISLLREPVSRNTAAVFQNLPISLQDDEEEILERLRNYPANQLDRWFDEDFIPLTGLDVFSMDIDPSAGHFEFGNDEYDVLMLKVDLDDERKSELISQFVGHEVTVERSNEAKSKWYADIYSKLRTDRRVLSKEFLEACMSLKYFRTFYSLEERRAVAERYSYTGQIEE